MFSRWSFGHKIGAGFAVIVALTVTLGVVSIAALRNMIQERKNVIVDVKQFGDAKELGALTHQMSSALRGFFITLDISQQEEIRRIQRDFAATLSRLKSTGLGYTERSLLAELELAIVEYDHAVETVIALRTADSRMETLSRTFDEQILPRRAQVEMKLEELIARTERRMETAREKASRSAAQVLIWVVLLAVATAVSGAVLALLLTRLLTRQISEAVQHLQSSSAELQSAAVQQAAGINEQATAISEIATTIGELLATSRQITRSAESVAQIAEQTARSAGAGTSTVDTGQASLATTRSQVDLIVKHMLDLGQKSQHIGSVLDIVSELAEQTNILAINATIEAVGAGETGKRFTVVADEIRKLADRVGGSTKEIRGLIDEVRSAVHTTVMSTEAGSKAVDANVKDFAEVAAALRQITSLVATSTEAAKEIHLSTQQQSTAVEQVNIAVTSISQAAKEAESSTSQTLQTSAELALLSSALLRLIRPQAAV